MARQRVRRTWASSLLVGGVFVSATLFALHGFSGPNDDAEKRVNAASEATSAFNARLQNRIRESGKLQEALGSSVECLEEITALIIADLALQQAQHDLEVAQQALDECLMTLPEPTPMTDVTPVDGEFSVLVR